MDHFTCKRTNKHKLHRTSVRLSGEDYDDGPYSRTPSAKHLKSSESRLGKAGSTMSSMSSAPEKEQRVTVQKEEFTQECTSRYLKAALFATILENTITQLQILAECNNELRIIKAMTDMDTMILEKYNVVQPQHKDNLAGIDSSNLGGNKHKLDKLASDRGFCSDTLLSTYLELAVEKRFDTLTKSNSGVEDQKNYYLVLVEEEARNKITRRELSKQLRKQRTRCTTVVYDTELIVQQLKAQVEDFSLVAEIKSRYIDNWQLARYEQNKEVIKNKESGPSELIKYYRLNTDYEARVHSEVEMLTNIYIDETLNKVETWMNKYDTDTEDLDLKIQLKKNHFQQQTDTRIAMEEKHALHDQQMKDWVDFKDKREAARQYHLKMTNAAVVVQAWWRGLLVRLELGPFKVTKKKGGKPAKGKK